MKQGSSGINDSLKEKTEYAVVYLHGFSASQEEGDPVHYTVCKKIRMQSLSVPAWQNMASIPPKPWPT